MIKGKTYDNDFAVGGDGTVLKHRSTGFEGSSMLVLLA